MAQLRRCPARPRLMATLGIHPHTIIKYFQCPATGAPGLLVTDILYTYLLHFTQTLNAGETSPKAETLLFPSPSSRSRGDQSASCHCLNLKAYFKSKHKQVKMMTVRKFPERPMLITKAINFHLMREQISNCLPLEILNFPLPRFSRKMSFLSEKCSLISSPSSTGGGSGYLMGK